VNLPEGGSAITDVLATPSSRQAAPGIGADQTPVRIWAISSRSSKIARAGQRVGDGRRSVAEVLGKIFNRPRKA
jgi:hypothetical protein